MRSLPSIDSSPHVVAICLGTRGDVQPFCVLGHELTLRGYKVTIVTLGDYEDLARFFDLDCLSIAADMEALARDPAVDALLNRAVRLNPVKILRMLRHLSRQMQDRVLAMLLRCLDAVGTADLVVFNSLAFFAGLMARDLGRPSIHVMLQPLLPSRQASCCLFGHTRDRGALLNRLSYHVVRALPLLLRDAFRRFRKTAGVGRDLTAFVNPLTVTRRTSPSIMAFSPAISPDPGDWPSETVASGFWMARPRVREALSAEVRAFIEAGPPPIYLGFGSMLWGVDRNSSVVLDAIALWGGRAIIGQGHGLKFDTSPSSRVLVVDFVNHALLFPHVAAVVHHGGAGTTAQVLHSGAPSLVLPVLAEQMYWGRRVAALGAGEGPVALSRVTPRDLARKITAVTGDPAYRIAARRLAGVLAAEPGVAAAVAQIETLLRRRNAA